ncbi:IclR family transcriptional regulator [Haloferax denitrificans]|uniref:IclR family transcriptional regulator n=1 Tax=Haloferax denitrificans TaxID=35745 RepID=UPI003C6F3B46
MTENAPNRVETSRKTIRVLDALREHGSSSVTFLARELGMNKSTVHNHLSTLEAEKFVVRDGTDYELSLRLLGFGGYVQHRHPLYQVAKREVHRLASQTGELANLMVEEYGQGVYLASEQGERAVDLDIYPGLRRPLHAIGLGKAILAHLPSERVDDIIEEHGLPAETDQTITDRAELDAQLATVRDRGYAVDNEELIRGLRCVGAPIVAKDGTVLGAISVSQPVSRMNNERFTDEVPDIVQSAANVIELHTNH